MKLRQESLLPRTDALPTSTVEFSNYAGKILVRYKDPEGFVVRQLFPDPAAAYDFFRHCVEQLRDHYSPVQKA